MEKQSNIDYEQILLREPLFKGYPLQGVDEMDILNLFYYNGVVLDKLKTIDSYCPICDKDTTFISELCDSQEVNNIVTHAGMVSGFSASKQERNFINKLEEKSVFIRKFNCSRKSDESSHNQVFIFRVIDSNLIKIGQHPTLADLTKNEIKKYRKLNGEIYSELNKAIGLFSHGIGIGAFVYLRRIIEKHILAPKINKLLEEGKITDEDFFKSDFKGKVNWAKDQLPDFLVKNKKIYSVLSKGIHELDENECKECFPVLKSAIEIILDEVIERNEKEKKNKLISAQLNKL
jgi:hypothetical protein